MRAVTAVSALLVLLLPLSGAETESHSRGDSAELKDLRALVQALTSVQTGMKNELQQATKELDKLKASNAAQQAELTAVKTRLAAAEAEVVNLENKITKAPKVAFSAGLTNSGHIVAGNAALNLVFTKVITNVGEAYSSITGFFTAPVRGVYYFRFNGMDTPYTSWAIIQMLKNGQQVMNLSDFVTQGHINIAGGLTLQLEVGDVVNMRIPAGRRLFDDDNNHSTFSGFLLFPL